jgi:hypothetical protein
MRELKLTAQYGPELEITIIIKNGKIEYAVTYANEPFPFDTLDALYGFLCGLNVVYYHEFYLKNKEERLHEI